MDLAPEDVGCFEQYRRESFCDLYTRVVAQGADRRREEEADWKNAVYRIEGVNRRGKEQVWGKLRRVVVGQGLMGIGNANKREGLVVVVTGDNKGRRSGKERRGKSLC
jgi:hypothetical protein